MSQVDARGGAPSSPSSKQMGRYRKTSSGGGHGRNSVSNGLVLQTIEDELRQNEAVDKQKGTLLMDLLRACIRLRNYSVPSVYRRLQKQFPVAQSGQRPFDGVLNSNKDVSGGGAAVSVAPDKQSSSSSGASSSLLNKLFAAPADLASSRRGTLQKKGSFILSSPLAKSSDRSESPIGVPFGRNEAAASTRTASPPSFGKASISGARASAVTLLDRLNAALEDDLGALGPILSEVVTLEDRAVCAYLAQRRREVSGTVYAGFHLLARRELSGTWFPTVKFMPSDADGDNDDEDGEDYGSKGGRDASLQSAVLPAHLSRILLMIGHEKSSLSTELGLLTVEFGGKRRRAALASRGATKRYKAFTVDRYRSHEGATAANEDERDDSAEEGDGGDHLDFEYDDSLSNDNDFDEATQPAGRGGRTAEQQGSDAYSHGLKYKDFIYSELCAALTDIYAELTDKLRNNTFVQSQGQAGGGGGGGGGGSACRTPTTLGQAAEERDYFRVRLSSLLRSFAMLSHVIF